MGHPISIDRGAVNALTSPHVNGPATIQVIGGACNLFVCANGTIDMDVVLNRSPDPR